jgi:prepilin-type N-terminal cleavage/methylation domain-containing protein
MRKARIEFVFVITYNMMCKSIKGTIMTYINIRKDSSTKSTSKSCYKIKILKKENGFSLVELSVVLVIIGVIIGGTLKGVELIKASELKSIVAEVDKYKSAVGQFKLTYGGLPGDLKDAASYWASSINGNSNGKIDAETSDEPFHAIEQLALSKYIDGTYTGLWGSGFVLNVAGITGGNVPVSKSGRDNASIYIKCCSTTDYSRTLNSNNHISIFSVLASNITKRAGILTPTEAFSIDSKIDDGIPDYGLVGGSGGYASGAYAAASCYSGTGSTSTYDSAVSANKDVQNCQMQFAFDWD